MYHAEPSELFTLTKRNTQNYAFVVDVIPKIELLSLITTNPR